MNKEISINPILFDKMRENEIKRKLLENKIKTQKENKKKRLQRNIVIIGAIVLVASITAGVYTVSSANTSAEVVSVKPVDENITNVLRVPALETMASYEDLNNAVIVESPNEETKPVLVEENPTEESITLENEESLEEQRIKEFSAIYEVDYNKVYSTIANLTNNFTSYDYLNKLTISGITFKGNTVYASSVDELLLLSVRAIAQKPNSFGLSSDEIRGESYKNDMDYSHFTAYVSKIVNTNPEMPYAIMQSESGFKSNMWNTKYNPAGIKNSKGSFVTYKNPYEGILEAVLEVKKYEDRGLTTPKSMASIYCPLSDGIDVNGLNKNWIDNVTHYLEKAEGNYDDLFLLEEERTNVK